MSPYLFFKLSGGSLTSPVHAFDAASHTASSKGSPFSATSYICQGISSHFDLFISLFQKESVTIV